jgi:hypothetical protein
MMALLGLIGEHLLNAATAAKEDSNATRQPTTKSRLE